MHVLHTDQLQLPLVFEFPVRNAVAENHGGSQEHVEPHTDDVPVVGVGFGPDSVSSTPKCGQYGQRALLEAFLRF